MKLRIFLFLFVGFISTAFAQQNYTLYNMLRIPQAMYANPSQLPFTKVNIGLPVISSVYFNLSNNGFKGKDLFVKRQDSLYLNPVGVISKLKADNYLSTAVQIDLLSVGIRVAKKHYISTGATEKMLIRFRYPKDFMQFVWEGNGGEDVIGRELNFNFGLDVTHYREYFLGYALQLKENLSFGLRLKYLYGMENIRTEKSDVTFYTDPTNFALTATSDIRVNTSGFDSTAGDKFDDVGGYMFRQKNRGYGVDLGATYQPFKLLTFSASLVDFGFIKWQDHVANYVSSNPGASFTYRGIGLNQFINDSTNIDKAFGKVLDTINDTYKINTINESYKTKLSTQIYFGATFNLTKKNRIGALYHSQFFDGKYHPGFSLSFTTMLQRWLSFAATYSILNRSYNNIGLGFSVNGGPLQLYAVTDNVLAPFYPMSSKNLNLRVGINLTFGKEKKTDTKPVPEPVKEVVQKKKANSDMDKDGIPDLNDLCPEVFGLAAFKGCPDRDKDSVPDKEDDCPDIAGLIAFHGCPDRDGDGIIDRLDSCPDVAGLPEFSGCPDWDKDGIEDKQDSCPTVAGLKLFDGCPDTDGDGFPDKIDNCPNQAGIAKFKGCPDTDGDGIIDSEDDCPDRPGLLAYRGCPDSDLDGIPDPSDDCPDTYGSKENKGCPLVKVVEKFESAAITSDDQAVLKSAFESLTFQSGKSIINQTSLTNLENLATLLKEKPDLKLYVAGHTDNVGNPANNLKLSQNRAKEVKKYLVTKGVQETQITTEGFGSTRPISENKTTEGKAKNRRVELKIVK